MSEPITGKITRDGEDFIVDAALVASRFRLSADEFRAELHSGKIVTVSEHGADEDEGRIRLTFRRGALLWRFIIEPDGAVREDPVLAKLERQASSGRR